MKKKVMVAVSGGVDSSVTALLLKESGYAVTGVTMCLGIKEEGDRTRCCGRDAIDDARHVCDQLQVPHFVFDYADQLEQKVIAKFTAEYLQGRTPNPCIDCNRYLKFGSLLAKAKIMGFDYLATGHYARIEKTDEQWKLLKPKDKIKDQTYFLYPIAAQDLRFILFPLGNLTKDEVRAVARKANLPVAQKAESQDICFVTSGDYRQFILERIGAMKSGDIVDMEGEILGRHRGLIYYTIGQRSGLGISAKKPLYVVNIDAGKNRVIAGSKNDLQAVGLVAGDLNLLTSNLPTEALAKIRYRKKPARCAIESDGNKLRINFPEAQESITPGQAVVLYDGEEVLGGGVIEDVIRDIS
jgi:tRNA-uridine 2-sulfurtransferase